MMNTYGLSQLPVLDEGKSVGSLREGRLMSKLFDNRDTGSGVGVGSDGQGFPVVSEDVGVETAAKYLKSFSCDTG